MEEQEDSIYNTQTNQVFTQQGYISENVYQGEMDQQNQQTGNNNGKQIFDYNDTNIVLNIELQKDYIIKNQRIIGQGGFGQVIQIEEKNVEENGLKQIVKVCKHLNAMMIQYSQKNLTIRIIHNNQAINKIMLHVLVKQFQNIVKSTLEDEIYINFDEIKIMDILKQIVFGIITIHKAGYIHRDIKPSNILLKGQQKKVKIGDFGIARQITENKTLTEDTGSKEFIAPEVRKQIAEITLQNHKKKQQQIKYNKKLKEQGQKIKKFKQENVEQQLKYNSKADIFSLGITFLKMISKNIPKYQEGDAQEQIQNIKKLPSEFLKNYVEENIKYKIKYPILEYIIHKTLQFDQHQRISAQDLYDYLNSDRQQQKLIEEEFKKYLQQQKQEELKEDYNQQ